MLVGEPSAGATEAVDDLVDDQENPVTFAGRRNLGQVLGWRHKHPHRTRHRFDHHGTDRLRPFSLDGVLHLFGTGQITRGIGQAERATVTVDRRHVHHIAGKRFELALPLGESTSCQGRQTGAVIGEVAAHYFMPWFGRMHLTLVLPGQFEGRLVRFGTAVDEITTAGLTAGEFGEAFRQL